MVAYTERGKNKMKGFTLRLEKPKVRHQRAKQRPVVFKNKKKYDRRQNGRNVNRSF